MGMWLWFRKPERVLCVIHMSRSLWSLYAMLKGFFFFFFRNIWRSRNWNNWDFFPLRCARQCTWVACISLHADRCCAKLCHAHLPVCDQMALRHVCHHKFWRQEYSLRGQTWTAYSCQDLLLMKHMTSFIWNMDEIAFSVRMLLLFQLFVNVTFVN